MIGNSHISVHIPYLFHVPHGCFLSAVVVPETPSLSPKYLLFELFFTESLLAPDLDLQMIRCLLCGSRMENITGPRFSLALQGLRFSAASTPRYVSGFFTIFFFWDGTQDHWAGPLSLGYIPSPLLLEPVTGNEQA